MAYIDENSVIWNEADDVVTVLVLVSGEFIELNAVGSAIWKSLAEHKSTNEIVDALAEKYNAPRSTLERDTENFIAAMVEKGLLNAGSSKDK